MISSGQRKARKFAPGEARCVVAGSNKEKACSLSQPHNRCVLHATYPVSM
jgi:hypothetical protein